MRLTLIGLALLVLTAVGAGAAPFARGCCDVFIYEPASRATESYAVQSRATGRAAVVETAPGQEARLVDGDAARTSISAWLSEARQGRLSTVTVEGRGSEVRFGDDEDDAKEEEEAEDEEGIEHGPPRGSLVHVRAYSAGKTNRLIDQIPNLPAEARTRMKAVVAAR